jgi:hypothetical protein
VARTYAGILGLLALVISLLRGVLAGGGTDSVLWTAWCCLLVFAVIGAAVGCMAELIVAEAVHGRITAELADRKAGPTASPAKAGGARG